LALFDDRKYVVQSYDLELGYKISTKHTICYVKRHPEENPKKLDNSQIFQGIPKTVKTPIYKQIIFYDNRPIEEAISNLSFVTEDNQIHYRVVKYIGDEDVMLSINDTNGILGSMVMKNHLGYIYRKDFCWIYDASHKQIAETKSHYIFTVKFTHDIMDVNGKKIGEIKPKWFTFPLKYTVDIYDTTIEPVFFIVLAIVFLELDPKRYLWGDISS